MRPLTGEVRGVRAGRGIGLGSAGEEPLLEEAGGRDGAVAVAGQWATTDRLLRPMGAQCPSDAPVARQAWGPSVDDGSNGVFVRKPGLLGQLGEVDRTSLGERAVQRERDSLCLGVEAGGALANRATQVGNGRGHERCVLLRHCSPLRLGHGSPEHLSASGTQPRSSWMFFTAPSSAKLDSVGVASIKPYIRCLRRSLGKQISDP